MCMGQDSSGPHLQILGGGSAVPDVARVIEEKVSQDARAKGAVQVEDARHQQARVKREVEAMIRDIRARARGPALPAEQSGGAGLPGGRPPSSPPEPSTAPTPAAMPARPPPSPGRGASDNGILFAPSPGQFTTVQQEHQPVGGSEGDKPVRVQRVHVPISFERFDGKVVVQQPPTVPGELGELSDATGVPAAPAAASPPRARRTSSKPENSEAFWDQVISDLRQSQYVAMLDALDDLRGAEMEKAASELRGRGTSRADVSLDVSFPSSMNSSRAPSPARAAARRELAKYDVEHDRSVGEAGPSGASAGPSLSGSFSSLHEHLAQPLDPLDSILGPSYGAPPSATGARVTHDPALPWRQGFGPGASAADRPAVRRSPAAEQLAAERLAAEARLREAYQQRLLRQSLGDEPLNPPGAAGPGRVNGSNGSRQQEQSHSLKASSIAAAGLTTNLDASLRGSMSASLNASLDTSALRLSSSALDERILSASLGEGWHPGASPPTQRAPSIHTSPAAPPAQQPAAAAPRVAAPPAARPHIFAPADSVDDTLSRSALWSSLSGSVGGGASVVVDVGGGGMSYTESLLARARRQPQAAPPHPSTVPVSKQSAPRTSPKVLAVAPMQLPSLAAASPPPPPASFGAVPALAAHPAAQQGFGLGAALRSRISPPAPVGVTCSANVDGAAATFELTQVGDALETRYEVQLRFESGEVPDEFRTAYLGSEARCEIQGLKHGSVFSCRARAVTSDDYSDFTPVVQFATPAPPRGLARTEQWVSRQRASAESTRRASDSVPLSYGAGLPGGMPYGGLGHGVPQRYSEHDFAGLSDLERLLPRPGATPSIYHARRARHAQPHPPRA